MTLPDIVLVAAACGFLAVACLDFFTLRIRNLHVLALGLLYVVFGLASGWLTLPGDLFAGAVLFLIGFISWFAGYQGGGDAKLAFVLGLFLGFGGLLPYAVLLILTTGTVFLLLRFGAGRRDSGGALARRLATLTEAGKAPFSVPMVAAALPVLIARAL